jgi:hypothetical protein
VHTIPQTTIKNTKTQKHKNTTDTKDTKDTTDTNTQIHHTTGRESALLAQVRPPLQANIEMDGSLA